MRKYTEFGKKQRIYERMLKKCVPVDATKKYDNTSKNKKVKVKIESDK